MRWNSILLVSFILAPAVIRAEEAPEIDAASRPEIEAASAPEIDAASAANLRRIATLMPVLQFKRPFAGVKYADWMAMMPEKIQNMPLSGIAIPGSHDSFTASLDYHGELGPSPDLSDTLVKVVNFFGSMAKKIIYNWGVTQGYSISDQLFAGIRYFDFRVAKRDSKHGEIYLLHSLFAQSAKEAFAEIQDFLNTHEKEVVIIDINHFYGMDAADHRRFISAILSTFGNKLATVRDFDQLTLANLWKGQERVILVYQAYYSNGRDNHLWHGIASRWLNTNSVSKAIEKLDMYYKIDPMDPIDDGFWVTQGVLTPTANDIIWGVASSLRKKLALPMCRAISAWVKDKKIGKGGINIVITDFVEENNFIGNVIGLNLK